MKRLWMFSLVLCMFCKTVKVASHSENTLDKIHLDSVCPEDGNCTVKLLRNKSMVLKRDGTGYLYYALVETTASSVIHYEYSRKTDPELQDAGYREEILFEIPNDFESLSLVDIDLAQVKMLFGRHCFCRGQAGYFQIQEGKLNLVKQDDIVTFQLDFTSRDVPQVIKTISAGLK